MSNLLELAVKAHGGLERWRKVTSIKVDASITGAIWFVKSKVTLLRTRHDDCDKKRVPRN
jgi:hypothetical protein